LGASEVHVDLLADFEERAQVEQAGGAVDRLRLLDSGLEGHIGSLIRALGVAEEDTIKSTDPGGFAGHPN
jgi:hypothetical protein